MIINIKVKKGTLERIRKERLERLKNNTPDIWDYMFAEETEKEKQYNIKESIKTLIENGCDIRKNNITIYRLRKMGAKHKYEYCIEREDFLYSEESVITVELLTKNIVKAINYYVELVEKYNEQK